MQQSPNKPAPTAAQQAMIHVVQSAGLSGLVSLLVAVTQYLTNNGNIDVHTLLSVLGGGFLTALTMIYKSVSTNPNLAQAALDTANEAHQKIDQIAPWLAKKTPPANIANAPTAVMPAVPQPIVFPQPQVIRQSTPPPAYQQQPMQQSPFPAQALSYRDMNDPSASVLGTLNLNTGQAYPPAQPAQQQPQQQMRQGG